MARCSQWVSLNLADVTLILMFQGPSTAVAFSRSGEYFASGGSDEQVSTNLIGELVAIS